MLSLPQTGIKSAISRLRGECAIHYITGNTGSNSFILKEALYDSFLPVKLRLAYSSCTFYWDPEVPTLFAETFEICSDFNQISAKVSIQFQDGKGYEYIYPLFFSIFFFKLMKKKF